MNRSKLLQMCIHLDDLQFRRLNLFVNSNFFNRHQQVKDLFDLLRSKKNGRLSTITDEEMSLAIFGESLNNKAKLNHVKNYLVKLIEKFLAWESAFDSELDESLFLSEAWDRIGMGREAAKQLKTSEQMLESEELRDENYHRTKYQINLQDFQLQIKSGKRNRDFNLQDLTDSLDISYIAEKLKMACILSAHQSVARQDYDTGLLNFLLEFLQDHPFLNYPSIKIYYHGYKTLIDSNKSDDLDALIECINLYANLFRNEDLRDIYLLAINGCIKRINSGNKLYLRKVFELYRSGLEQEVFLTKGELSTWTYKNIAVSGLKLGEYDWVKNFNTKYKNYLPESNRESYYTFNLARYHFEKKEFQDAMPLLSTQEYADLLTNLSAKTMLVKMYFELNEFEPLSSLLSSFRKYISRKKILGYHRENYLAIIGYLQKIMDTPRSDKAILLQLRNEIEQSSVSEKEWLVEQLS